MREINWFFLLSLEERKKSFLSLLFLSRFCFIFYYAQQESLFSRQIVIVILLRVVGVVFIKKDDAAYDDVHCEDASSTPRW